MTQGGIPRGWCGVVWCGVCGARVRVRVVVRWLNTFHSGSVVLWLEGKLVG